MKFHDLNVRGNDFQSDLLLIKEANRLGWNHITLIYSPDRYNNINYKDDLKTELDIINQNNYKSKDFTPLTIDFGLEINVKNPNDVRKYTRKYRNKTNLISVFGGDEKINRIACENNQVDILSRPYFRRWNSGINHVLAKEAVKNNVAIELCFNDILTSYLSYRAKIIANFREIIKLHKKFSFPLVITTGSKSIWDIRSPKDIFAVFRSLGLTEDEINNCFSKYPQEIINFNNERKNMIIYGVKVIDK
ncbi:ribonuclease P protein component 3 [Methanobrevibacter cuticularis]|uniref:Ribonuclease P protein component 3 n=1 Tax=Methanobrevibacter cuticularis TaxID=47311 RepID=A0A166E9X4_9EURY|nr:RNase P subunit p30 family protein [Methanobrevibacter cuticularis]KZX16431.1 ribonuclease P protein component 3 [Methanobrevibacter cuticularis]